MNSQDAISRRLRGEHLTNLRDYTTGTRLKWNAERGYSDEFAAAHDEVLRGIVDNPQGQVTVVAGLDDICNSGVCPRLRDHCRSAELEAKDHRVAATYGVAVDATYRSDELMEKLSTAAQDTK